MSQALSADNLRGVWSATPTPFTEKMQVDVVSVRRLVEHHLRLGVKGLFLAGSCGEGPWMTDDQRRSLVEAAAEQSRGRLLLAAQVTDNSAARILENIARMQAAGAQIAVIAPPFMHLHPTPAALTDLYLSVIRDSPLPVGFYDLGRRAPVFVPEAVLRRILAQPRVILLKDSSLDSQRREVALRARRRRPDLCLLSGYEFDCVDYLQAGYDSLLLGGGIFNGYLANLISQAVVAGDLGRAQAVQRRMNRMMWAVYGGRRLTCWLAGLKYLLVRLGVFRTTRNYLGYTLTDACRRAIDRMVERERDVLLPGTVKPHG